MAVIRLNDRRIIYLDVIGPDTWKRKGIVSRERPIPSSPRVVLQSAIGEDAGSRPPDP